MATAVSQLLSFFVKLLLGVFAVIFTVSLLAAALIVVTLSLLASLITGRRPAPTAVFGRFQRFSRQGMWPGGSVRREPASPSTGEVVDVEVREIVEEKRRP